MYEVIFNYKSNQNLTFSTHTPELVKIVKDGLAHAEPGGVINFMVDGNLFSEITFYPNMAIVECEAEIEDESRVIRSRREYLLLYHGNFFMLDDGTNHVEVVRSL